MGSRHLLQACYIVDCFAMSYQKETHWVEEKERVLIKRMEMRCGGPCAGACLSIHFTSGVDLQSSRRQLRLLSRRLLPASIRKKGWHGYCKAMTPSLSASSSQRSSAKSTQISACFGLRDCTGITVNGGRPLRAAGLLAFNGHPSESFITLQPPRPRAYRFSHRLCHIAEA